MALKLSLKPGERIVVNGAVIENGDRRSVFVIENRARVLRESDIMQPEDAVTPASLIYLAVMMMYIELEPGKALFADYDKRMREFTNAVTTAQALETCALINVHVANRDFYKALSACRELMAFEQTRLNNVA